MILRMQFGSFLYWASAVLICAQSEAASFGSIRTVVMSDWTTPSSVIDEGTFGPIRSGAANQSSTTSALLKDFDVNSSGRIVFTTTGHFATPSESAEAAWLWTGGNIQRIASTSNSLSLGANLKEFSGRVWLSGQEDIVFSGTLAEVAERRFIEALSLDGLRIAEGNSATGLDSETVFGPGPTYSAHSLSPNPFYISSVNDYGEVVFIGLLDGPTVTIDNDEALWSTRGGALSLVIREGQSVPAFGPQAVVGVNQVPPPGWIGPDPPFFAIDTSTWIATLNDTGDVIVNVPIFNGTVPRATMRTSSSGSPLMPFIYNGAPATATETFVNTGNFAEFSLNDKGHIVFSALFRRSTGPVLEGLWLHDGNEFTLIAEEGQIAPGTVDNATFRFMPTVTVAPNESGEFGFRAALNPVTGKSGTVWRGNKEGIELVMRVGDAAPGFNDGTVFRFMSHDPVLVNNRGQLIFSATIGQPTDAGPDTLGSLWMADRYNELTLIAMVGGAIEVNPGEFRTIALLDNISPHHLTDSQFVFWARFTDGTDGLFSYSLVPEPTSPWLISIAILGLLLKRRRS